MASPMMGAATAPAPAAASPFTGRFSRMTGPPNTVNRAPKMAQMTAPGPSLVAANRGLVRGKNPAPLSPPPFRFASRPSVLPFLKA